MGSPTRILLGEKHVPIDKHGHGWWDCSTYDGEYPKCWSRNTAKDHPPTTNPKSTGWSFGSRHTGVIQFCFADGHVRALPETINPVTLRVARHARRRDGHAGLLRTMNPTDAFAALDLRVGRVVRCEPNAGAEAGVPDVDRLRPARRQAIERELTDLYTPESLVGRLVIAAVNLGPKTINGFTSEVLVLGLPDAEGRIVLLALEREVPLGGRVY